jgi:ABC-type amino acid transport substrate-binding protein
MRPSDSLRRTLVGLLLVGLVAGLAVASPRFDAIAERGHIRIGLNADYPPFCTWESGEPRGFDVQLARAVTAKLGLDPDRDIVFSKVTPATTITALEAGEIDLAIAALTATSDRARRIAFSKPYYVATLAALVPRTKIPEVRGDNLVRPLELRSVVDLRKMLPLTLAVKRGTTIPARAERLLPGSRVVEFPSLKAATAAVVAGQADVLIHEDPYLRHLAAGALASKGAFQAVIGRATSEPLAIACRQGDADFVRWLNLAIDELAGDGRLAQWEKTYFDSADWRRPENQP